MRIDLPPALLLAALLLCVGSAAQAQRHTSEGATAGGAPAQILYRNDFEIQGQTGFEATGYSAAKFFTGEQKKIADQAKVEGFTVAWTGRPETAFGSPGALKIAITGSDVKGATAERYFDWPADGTTVAMLVYAHGVNTFFVQGWGRKADRNLHMEFPVAKQDEWQFVKTHASAFVGWGGGSVSPGETFGNLSITANELDKSVERPYLLVDNLVLYQNADNVPPSAPQGVQAAADAKTGGILLTWKPATDDVCIAGYEVHRSTEVDFRPALKTRIAAVAALQYLDRDVQSGQTFHYIILAKDAGGNKTPAPAVTVVAPKVAGGSAEKPDF